MSNPLYQMMQPKGPQNDLVTRFRQFQQNFRGDPRQRVQELLNSGRVSQQQYNQAVQTANQLRRMLGM